MSFVFSDEQLEQLGERAFVVVDGVAGDVAARAAHAAAHALVDDNALRPAGVSRAGAAAPAVRGDLTIFLDDDALPAGFVGVVEALTDVQRALRQQAWLTLGRRELQLACYPGGGAGYDRHRDAFRGAVGVTGQRRVTVVLWLNPDWEPAHGGVLRCFDDDSDGVPRFVDVQPRLDRAIVFMSEQIEHAVLPSFAARYALTLWLSPA